MALVARACCLRISLSNLMCAASWGVGGARASLSHAGEICTTVHAQCVAERDACGWSARTGVHVVREAIYALQSQQQRPNATISAPRPALGPRGGSHRVEVSLGGRLRGGRGSRRPALGLCTRGWREREAGSQRAAREACRGAPAPRASTSSQQRAARHLPTFLPSYLPTSALGRDPKHFHPRVRL